VRVLQVIHDYLPLHAAGSEIYTANLCRALKGAGHEVAVFTCEVDRAQPQWSLREREHEGVPVFEGIYNRIYADVSEHWDDPQMAPVFEGVLDRWRPDLVHVQGLQFVGGVSALRAAASRRLPVVMTLHEYWWLCPRAGLMYDLTGLKEPQGEGVTFGKDGVIYLVSEGGSPRRLASAAVSRLRASTRCQNSRSSWGPGNGAVSF